MDLDFMRGRTGYYRDSGTATNAGSGGDEAVATAPNRGGSDVIAPASVEREHMFDKVVTPSDVGKLNRLVIPKQHAEKYFPLDSSANENGLILNFEDRNGKPWRFRYSYWNSSQSYVMTKGWSRFVKEKKLDAGDVVSFQRGAGEAARDRLFIDWRRRPNATELQPPVPHHHQFSFLQNRSPIHPWSPLFLQPSARSYTHLVRPNKTAVHHYNTAGAEYQKSAYMYGTSYPTGSVVYLTPAGGTVSEVFESMPVVPVPVPGKKASKAKKLRLFGVTMDCPASDSDDCEIIFLDSSPSSSMTVSHNSTPNGDTKGKSSMSLDLEM